MSASRITFSLDREQDAKLIARLDELARQNDMSATIRAALYAHLFPQDRDDGAGTILAAIEALRCEVRALDRPPARAPAGAEDPGLGQALDAQLDEFFSQ